MTCWAFKNVETFKKHALDTLECFRKHFSYIIPIISKRSGIDEETVRKSVEIGIALHDIGKTSKNYDETYYGHEFYSGYLIYNILKFCCNSDLKPIVAISAMQHHQAMDGRQIKEILKRLHKLKMYERNEECERDIQEVLEYIGVNVKDIPTSVTPNDVEKWFYNLNLKVEKNLYVIILGPLMVCDTVVANKNRGDKERKNRIIEEYEKWL